VQSLVAPSLGLDPETDMLGSTYPFSVKVEGAPLGPEDLMRLQRDHYEGTPYDLTQGPGAGPFGDPQVSCALIPCLQTFISAMRSASMRR
jgi:dipeptidase